ncbi:hypothetical protein RO3G_01692 [Rhizopus delemar RA 99-880]|uniref:Uncharacterized protein n=1 Tax=Rhizopus delemar (strain RA 99-880 / ATCC MYA-4621 / FGSC 9543 / NRRL 43880) TaxID=246409 RepID=I1BLA8_RHIO9|nr:hypothetical protein RO3G_01692 [Rhizopus delemar RA 99-880]|eukprot:EIE76988.1 hypothetical protein RO3G_01692 [Rhizopus delemar RA 99-880]
MTIDSLLNNRILANGRVIHYYVVTLEQPMLIYNIHDIRTCSKFALRMVVILVLVATIHFVLI